MPNFIALTIYLIFGTIFFWNEGLILVFTSNICYFSRNFDFIGGYVVVTTSYLMVTAHYLVVTACYHSLLFVPTFDMNIALLATGGYCSLALVTARSHF